MLVDVPASPIDVSEDIYGAASSSPGVSSISSCCSSSPNASREPVAKRKKDNFQKEFFRRFDTLDKELREEKENSQKYEQEILELEKKD